MDPEVLVKIRAEWFKESKPEVSGCSWEATQLFMGGGTQPFMEGGYEGLTQPTMGDGGVAAGVEEAIYCVRKRPWREWKGHFSSELAHGAQNVPGARGVLSAPRLRGT